MNSYRVHEQLRTYFYYHLYHILLNLLILSNKTKTFQNAKIVKLIIKRNTAYILISTNSIPKLLHEIHHYVTIVKHFFKIVELNEIFNKQSFSEDKFALQNLKLS